ncbi:DUF11 domain-containing protein [Streptomyces sp. NPDC089919]|uniref:DUF11 domain-containing protein n=1 Tax=Streptomyces sp. NPDC089919 TaxID=3155188 RepID=UPI0034407D7F
MRSVSYGPAARGPRRGVLTVCAGAAACLLLAGPPPAAAAPGPDTGPSVSGPATTGVSPAAPESASGTPVPSGSTGGGPASPAGSGSPDADDPQRAGRSADLTVTAAVRRPAAAEEPAEPAEQAVQAVAETFDYLLTATNHGPSTAREVVVTDRLPAQLEFVSSADGCTAAGRTVRCGPLPVLAVGATRTWVITVRLADGYAGDGSDVVNEAEVGSGTADPVPDNNKTSLTGLKVPPDTGTADLALAKTALLDHGRSTVERGERFTYRVTVVNHGPAAARGVEVTDRLPEQLVFLSSPDGCTAEGADRRRVVCPQRDRLAAGARAEYRITVRAAGRERSATPQHRCTPVDNIARVTSDSRDPDPSDNANRPGTTAPGGKPLCLREGSEGHGGHEGDHGSGGNGDGGQHGHHEGDHHDRGDLADSGARLPGWLMWAAGALVAAGAGLRTAAARRTRRTGGSA